MEGLEKGEGLKNRKGLALMNLSILTRGGVLLLLILFALWVEYINLKNGYNNPRLVELSSGKLWRWFYEYSDAFFSLFGEPMAVMQTNGGMTWSIRVFGIPFTDPVALLSILTKNLHTPLVFFLGALIPIIMAVLFGRVFCSYICPASLLFFTISRIRRFLQNFLYFPELKISSGLAWGVLLGGLTLAHFYSHGIWALILPYFAVGQSLFQGIAFGVLAPSVFSLCLLSLSDLILARQFTCRFLCPTGQILGLLGRRSAVSIRRDAPQCISGCQSCDLVCPLQINPRLDHTQNCSLCAECVAICPTGCLTIGVRS